MKKRNSYLDFANDDYYFIQYAYNEGRVANQMAALSQEVCEKYLKYVIDEFVIPKDQHEEIEKTDVLHAHNLKKLMKYINDSNIEFDINEEKVMQANGYYFSARYPGEDSYFVDKKEIDVCIKTAQYVRDYVHEYVCNKSLLPIYKLTEFNDAKYGVMLPYVNEAGEQIICISQNNDREEVVYDPKWHIDTNDKCTLVDLEAGYIPKSR